MCKSVAAFVFFGIGFSLSLPILQVTNLLNRMQLHAQQSVSGDSSTINVSVPPTRSDVLHPCDVMEVLIVLNLVILLICLSLPNMFGLSHLYFY
jgi:hypothetical protein